MQRMYVNRMNFFVFHQLVHWFALALAVILTVHACFESDEQYNVNVKVLLF